MKITDNDRIQIYEQIVLNAECPRVKVKYGMLGLYPGSLNEEFEKMIDEELIRIADKYKSSCDLPIFRNAF